MPLKDPHRRRCTSAAACVIARCYNPDCPQYPDYGGRGIQVWSGWLLNRRAFIDYLVSLEGSNDHSLLLDRKDNSKGYEPGNLRYVSSIESNTNRRSVVMLSHNGQTLSMKAWARESGISYTTIVVRKKLGWSDERILSTPVNLKHSKRRKP